MLDNGEDKSHILYEMRLPTAFMVQLDFHVVPVMRREFTRKSLKVVRDVMSSTVEGMKDQCVQRALDALTKSY